MGIKELLMDGWFKLAVLIVGLILAGSIFLLLFVNVTPKIRPPTNPNKSLSTELVSKANAIVKLNERIVGIQIVSFNLPKNTRSMVHTYMDNDDLNRLYTEQQRTSVSGNYPIFTDDQKNNARIIRLLNHEFVCTPFSESITSKIIPESNKYITTICAVAIPPSYGAFSGIIAVLLTAPPSENDVAYLRTALNRLSSEIGYL